MDCKCNLTAEEKTAWEARECRVGSGISSAAWCVWPTSAQIPAFSFLCPQKFCRYFLIAQFFWIEGLFPIYSTRPISRAESLAVPKHNKYPSTGNAHCALLQTHSFPFQHPSGLPFQSSLHILEILNVMWMFWEIGSGMVSSQMLWHPALLTSFPPGLCFLPSMGRYLEVQGQTGWWPCASSWIVSLRDAIWTSVRQTKPVAEFVSLLAGPPESSKCFWLVCRDAQDLRDVPCQTLVVLLIGCEILEWNYLSLLTTQHISRCLSPQQTSIVQPSSLTMRINFNPHNNLMERPCCTSNAKHLLKAFLC